MRRMPSAIARVLVSQAVACGGVSGVAWAAAAPQDAPVGGSAASAGAGAGTGASGGTSASGSGFGAGASQSNAFDDMARRLEALEKRNAALQQEVVDLKAESGERWLTEERAAEIRGIVQDVLSDAGERSSLQSSGMTAGWDDGFFLSSADGRFRMNMAGFSQARWVWSEMRESLPTPQSGTRFPTNLTATGFDLPNTQLWIDGHILSPDVTYMVKARFANQSPSSFNYQSTTQPGGFVNYGGDGGSFQLMDAWVRIALTDEWSFRAGQFRSPYSRDFLVLEQYQMAVARSVIAEHYSIGYTQGLELEYLSDEMRWRLSVNDGGNDYLFGPVQVVGSQPWNSSWDDQPAKWAVTSRFEWKGAGSWRQFDQFTSPEGTDPGWLFGIAFNLQGSNPTEVITGSSLGFLPYSSGQSNDWFGITADYTMLFGGASLYVAGYWNYVSSHSAFYPNQLPSTQNVVFYDIGNTYAMGAQVQFAGYFAPKWEAFVRYEYGYANNSDPWIRPDSGPGAGTIIQFTQGQSHLSIATVGVNWYIDGQDLKVSADFGYAFTPVDPAFATPQIGWRGSESDEFVMRAQIQLMF